MSATRSNGTRIAVERFIVRELIRHLARHGWSPYINDDGGEHVYCPTEERAMASVFAVDESRLHFAPTSLVNDCRAAEGSKRAMRDARMRADRKCHAVLLICGNGEDIISDWSFSDDPADTFKAAMDAYEGPELDGTEKRLDRALGQGLAALELLREVQCYCPIDVQDSIRKLIES
jgi:hypothetical protein